VKDLESESRRCSRTLLIVSIILAAGPTLGQPSSPQACPPAGDARNPQVRQLNLLKNRDAAPTQQQMDAGVTLEAMLAPGDDLNRFDENRGASIRGIVVRVLPGGVESVNCHARDFAHRDTHIELALSPTAVPTDRLIVEVTPLWRQLMAARGIDWSTPSLNVNLVGRKVEVTGWLMFDREHVTGSRNTSPGNPQNWRATAWEVHPITEIRLLP
jgi:hypothetical protein